MTDKQGNWVICDTADEGDSLRWSEPLWAEPNKPRGKRDKIGEQQITAKLLQVGDLLEFEVISAIAITPSDAKIKVKAGDIIRRKYSSIEQGDCHKLAK